MQGPGSGHQKVAYNTTGSGLRIALAQMPMVLLTAWWNAWCNILVPPIQRHQVIEPDLKDDPLAPPEPFAAGRAGCRLFA